MDQFSDVPDRLDSPELIKRASAAGYGVSARMLETFRAQGLLPRPIRTGHHGRAPVWIYPASADRQLIALMAWREHTKDPDVLRVLLWVDGFPIPLAAIKTALAGALQTMLDLLDREITKQAKQHGLDPDQSTDREHALGLIASTLAAKRGPKALPRHARVSAGQRTRAVELIMRGFALGEPVTVTTEEAATVERVLGVSPNGRRDRVDGAGPWLTGPAEDLFDVAGIVAVPRALTAVLDATDAELETARQMAAVLWRYLPLLARMLAALFEEENYAGMSGLGRLDQQPEFVVILVPTIVAMLRAGWEQNIQLIATGLADLPTLAEQSQRILGLPTSTVDANLAGKPADVQTRARRLILAALDGAFDYRPHESSKPRSTTA